MFQSLNLEVEKAKAIEKARQEKAIREHTSKIAETVSQPISSYGLFQKLQKSEMKTGLIKDVISPDEAMKEFEERLENYGLHKDNEVTNMMTNVLRTRQDAIDIRNLTKYTQTILNKFISNIQTNGARKKNININPRIDD
jgi:hypothetical protein